MCQRIEEECQRIVIAAQEAKEQAEAMKALASCLSSLARRLQSSLLPTPPPSTNETQSTEIAAPSEDNIAVIPSALFHLIC